MTNIPNVSNLQIWTLIGGIFATIVINTLIKKWLNRPEKEYEERRTGQNEIVLQIENLRKQEERNRLEHSKDIKDVNLDVVKGFAKVNSLMAKKVDLEEFSKLRDEIIRHIAKEDG